MGRPREHDVDALLDDARKLWAERGLAALTVRALCASSGVPNGAIYHAFGSRDGLVARVWSREAALFLDRQRAALDAAADPIDAIVAVACSPADFARDHPEGAALLLSVRPEDLLTDRVAAAERKRVTAQKREFGDLVTALADRLWGRSDRNALAVATMCVVDLPGALLLQRDRLLDPLARTAVATAVRAIASQPPPR